MCVSAVCVCVGVSLACLLSRAPRHLSCERRSVEAEMHFHVRRNVLRTITASLISSLPKPLLPAAAEAGVCVRVSP